MFRDWIGRESTHTQRIAAAPVAALAATLDMDEAPGIGSALPPGWQWLFFNPIVRRSQLGDDGHPRRGDLLPPIALPRRMWAGSRIRYLAPLRIGALATRTSRILRIVEKIGKTGPLCFVTVAHTIASEGLDCIVEEQDIVYRDGVGPHPTTAAPSPATPVASQWTRTLTADTTLLFRYSALTSNGHRIHYDLPYARDVEGYRGLVVQGPLMATLLQGLALACRPGKPMSGFEFKGVNPLFVGAALTLQAWPDSAGGIALRALDAQAILAMQASARWPEAAP
jgi:3-methylfumaryl-CoA hydratase